MEWGCAAEHDNYDFNPKRLLWNAHAKYLENWLQCQNSHMQQVPSMLPGPVDQVMQTTCFNFTNQLYSLVSGDPALFGKLDNPFGKYVPPNGLLSTTNPGQWRNTAYWCHKVKDPAKDFMMPIITACDKTHLQKGGKPSIWPLLLTTSILNQKMQNNLMPIAWLTLAYVNNLLLKTNPPQRTEITTRN
jgi:hypothetical protein